MESKISKPSFVKILNYDVEVHNLVASIGWDKCIQSSLILDKNGEPMPWYNYTVVEFLKEKLTKDINVFEYGSGFSTFFYGKYCKSVTSVEISEECYLWVMGNLKNLDITNCNVLLEKPNDFTSAIVKFQQKFDIIVIDSADRINCAKFAMENITANGVIILDNSEREKYSEIFKILTNVQYKFLNFSGIKPMSTDVSRTTIFYRRDNIFGI